MSNSVNSFFSYLSTYILTEREQKAGWSSAGVLAFFYCITVAYIQRNVLKKNAPKWWCKFGWRLSDLVSFYHIAYGNRVQRYQSITGRQVPEPFFMFLCTLLLSKYLHIGHPFILWHRENLSPFCEFFLAWMKVIWNELQYINLEGS